MAQKTIWTLLLLIGVVSSQLTSCKRSCDDCDPWTIYYIYENKTDHHIDIRGYEHGDQVSTYAIEPNASLKIQVIQDAGKSLLYCEKLEIIFDSSRYVSFTEIAEPYSLFNLDNYQQENISKGVNKYTYIITEDLYNIATTLL